MKNLILILVIFLAGEIFSQVTAPSSYTTNYGYRKWVQGANPSADSINANWNELDADIKAVYDTAQVKVNLYGAQTIAGTKTISGILSLGTAGRLTLGTLVPAANGQIGYEGAYLKFYHSSGTIDTVAMLDDVRSGASGYAALTGATFTGDVSVGQDFRMPYDSVAFDASEAISADNKSVLFLYSFTSAEEDIATINGGSDGKIIYLINTDASGYVATIKDNTGNIQTAGDFAMGLGDTMTLIYNSVDSKWYELSRSNN
jgi:hypothetical protein